MSLVIFDVDTYKQCGETYYQFIWFFSGQKGPPFKLKLPLIAQLIESEYIVKPWNHLCQSFKKSNHNAKRIFQTRTMRGCGTIYHQNPPYLVTAISFCRFLDVFNNVRKCSSVFRKTLTTKEVLEGAKTFFTHL